MAQIGCRILDRAVGEVTRRLVSEIFNELLIGRRDPARPALPRGEQDGSGASTMMRGLRRARDAGRA